jgi:adenylate kinase
MIAVFLGPPGSGKGTQAATLAERLGFVHFDMGGELRKEARSGSSLGKTIASFTDRGELVPIEVIKRIVGRFFSERDRKSVILDGFPRSVKQAQVLEEILAKLGKSVNLVVYFDISEERLVERIVNRRYCPACNRVYNLLSKRPARDEVCDEDGAALTRRADDDEAVVRNRIRVYERETRPMVEYYRLLGKLVTLDASKGVSEAQSELEGYFKIERAKDS